MNHSRAVVISILMMLLPCACERLDSSQIALADFCGAWQGVDSENNTRHFVNSKYWQTHQE